MVAVLWAIGSVACVASDPAPSPDPQAQRPVLGAHNKPLADTLGGRIITDELVVTVRGLAPTEVDALAADVGGGVAFRGSHTGAYVFRFDDADAAVVGRGLLRARRGVVEVAPSRVLAGTGIGTTPIDHQWNLRALNLNVDQPWGTATGVRVAVLDTGIAYEDYSDGSGTYARAPNLSGVSFAAGYDFVNDDAHANDDQGHGTHIAGIIAASDGTMGVAPGAELLPVKVLDVTNQGTELGLAEAIIYATDNGADVINMSLAFSPAYFPSRFMQLAIDYAASNGVVLVAAVGNDGAGVVTYPAAFRDVIAVGATSLKRGFHLSRHGDPWRKAHKSQRVTAYSNTGTLVDVTAPGGSIDHDVDGDGNPEAILAQSFSGDPTDFGYYLWAGTSQAAAHASAVAALALAANPDLTPADVRALLGDTANQHGGHILDDEYGRGRLDVDAVLDSAPTAGNGTSPQYFVGIRLTLRQKNSQHRRAYAEVQVVDEAGNPVKGIRVHGTFTGGIYDQVEGKTDKHGMKTFASKQFGNDASVVAFQVNAVTRKSGGERIFDRPHGQIHIDSCSLDALTQFVAAAGIGTTPLDPPLLSLAPLAVKFDVPAHPKEIPSVTLMNFSWGLSTVPMVVVVEEDFFNDTFPSAPDVTTTSFGTGIGTTPIVLQPSVSLPFLPDTFTQTTDCVDLVVRTFSVGAGIGTTPFTPVLPAPTGNCQEGSCDALAIVLRDLWLAFGTGIGTTPDAGDYPGVPPAVFASLTTMMQGYADFGYSGDASPVALYATVLNAAGLSVTPVSGGSGSGTGSVPAN